MTYDASFQIVKKSCEFCNGRVYNEDGRTNKRRHCLVLLSDTG